jgi:predicted ATPase
MITRIEIDGFKSLRNFSLVLVPFMGIVGINGAGKSNLFEALSLLSRLASMDVISALKAGRGHIRDQFARNKEAHEIIISISIELLLPKQIQFPWGEEIELTHTRVRYEVQLGSTPKIGFKHEKLSPILSDKDTWAPQTQALKNRRKYSEKIDFFSMLEKDPEEPTTYEWIVVPSDERPWGRSSLLEETKTKHFFEQFPNLVSSRTIQLATLEFLRNIHLSQFEPNQLRTTSQAADTKTLARDGSNLPTVLASLAPEEMANVRANFVRFVPGVSNIEVLSRDDELYIEVSSSDGQKLPARLLSDGTLRILALLTLVYSAPPGSLIAIEELENGVYSGRLLELLELLKEISAEEGGPQILLSSHSPTIIAALKNKPGALAFLDVVQRAGLRSTRVRQIREGSHDPRTNISTAEVERILATTQREGL